MTARHRILQRLRKATRPTSWPAVKPEAAGEASSAQLTEAFRSHLVAAQAEVVITTTTAWPAQVAQLALSRGWRRWLLSSQAEVTQASLACLQAVDEFKLAFFDRDTEELDFDLFTDIDVSLTSTKAAIADTGTLVLWPDATEPRQMSLVPPVHMAVIHASDLYPNLATLMARQAWAKGPLPTNLVLISGPSKTADIQQTLAYGAHGPKTLVVILLTDR